MDRLSFRERALLFYGTRLPNHPRKWWLHSRLRKWVGVSIDRDIEVVRTGLRWFLNPADFAHSSLFWLGSKDSWDLYHLRRLLRPGSVILDIGANFGYYALTLATTLDRRCQVHALEPDPGNFDRLRRHIALNGLEDVVQAHCLGVADHPETVTLTRHGGNSGHTAIAPDGEIRGVMLTTLDAFCETENIDRLDVVILDVEGLEEHALRGAERTLTRFRPLILVELFPPVMSRQGSSPEAAARILTALGYQLFAARRDRLEPLAVMPVGDCRENAFGFHRENRIFSGRPERRRRQPHWREGGVRTLLHHIFRILIS